MFLNKNIYKIKLTLNTSCNSSCRYCFVKKTNERMSFDVAKKSIDLLLSTPGKEKLLSLFGGEPFLDQELVKKIILYARKKEKEFSKKLIISICTNLLILNKKIIDMLKAHDIKISVSLVGKEDEHNEFRFSANVTNPYEEVVKNLRTLRANMPEDNLGISFVILPSTVGNMWDNLQHIVDLNLSRNINFEIVQEFEVWDDVKRKIFFQQLRKIAKQLFGSIGKGNQEIYLNPVAWELKHSLVSRSYSVICLFEFALEVYPSGDMAFSPFLLNRKKKKEYVIGNVLDGRAYKYRECEFNDKSEMCKKCEKKYFNNTMRIEDKAYIVKNFYDFTGLEIANLLKKRINNNKIKKYCKRIYNQCF